MYSAILILGTMTTTVYIFSEMTSWSLRNWILLLHLIVYFIEAKYTAMMIHLRATPFQLFLSSPYCLTYQNIWSK